MIKAYTIYQFTPDDTRQMRATLKAAGLTVKRCRILGGGRWCAMVHTDDNEQAYKVLRDTGRYEIEKVFFDTLTIDRNVFMSTEMRFRKVKNVRYC